MENLSFSHLIFLISLKDMCLKRLRLIYFHLQLTGQFS